MNWKSLDAGGNDFYLYRSNEEGETFASVRKSYGDGSVLEFKIRDEPNVIEGKIPVRSSNAGKILFNKIAGLVCYPGTDVFRSMTNGKYRDFGFLSSSIFPLGDSNNHCVGVEAVRDGIRIVGSAEINLTSHGLDGAIRANENLFDIVLAIYVAAKGRG